VRKIKPLVSLYDYIRAHRCLKGNIYFFPITKYLIYGGFERGFFTKNFTKYFCTFFCYRKFKAFFYFEEKKAFFSGRGLDPPPPPLRICLLRMLFFFMCSLISTPSFPPPFDPFLHPSRNYYFLYPSRYYSFLHLSFRSMLKKLYLYTCITK